MMDIWGGKPANLTVFVDSIFKKSACKKSVDSTSGIWEMFVIVFQ